MKQHLRSPRQAMALAPLLLAGLSACQAVPSLESIKYGYSPSRVEAVREDPISDDYNDMAAGWAPEPSPDEQPPTLYGRDGSPVGSGLPGVVMETKRPINDGVDAPPPGSRNMLLDRFVESQSDRERLTRANEDLEMALELSETRANDFEQQLKALQRQYDELGRQKQGTDQKVYDLAARLATAQIARLEAERALLQATLEWRSMAAKNNRSLTGGESGRQP